MKTKRFGLHDNAERMFLDGFTYYEVDSSVWSRDIYKRMLTETVGPKILIQEKINSLSVLGSVILDVDRGITPIIPVDGEISPKAALVFVGNFDRYSYSEDAIRVKYDKSLAEYTPPKYFQNDCMVIRRIISRQQRIIAAQNTEGYLFNKSYLLAYCLPQTGYNLRYVLAIIASKLHSRLFIWSSEIARRDDFPQLDIQTIRNLSIRRINFTLTSDQRAYYLEKAKSLYAICLEKHDQQCVLDFVDHHLSREPEESDVVHDKKRALARRKPLWF